ncbi:pyridoxal phosphate-dependent aminotransferase [[Clostridium] symbiosum]|jgi:cysteine-S-conjugate beta-lyase|uniref:MalY/PatB family protein n=1 Tax=Clostridium symbiosum TaxID=1512 RepID=UPI000E4AA9CD|nr:MalY/PatB family protein [[Clostridium] symbiosum]RGY63166.1 pyridoxal phosphate-dependent aminotransferase [[Clostridium] symbiosum]
MGKLILDKLYNRKGTDCVKWDHKDFVDSRVSDTALPLWLSDMEFKVADEITEALIKRVEHGFLGHSMPGDSYFESVQGWYKRRFNWTILKDSIFYSPGVLPALGFILRGFTKKGEGVIIQEPVFYPFAELIEGTDRKIVNNQLINNDENYSIDFIDLENKLKDPNNTMLILCSPHNPVGRVWTKDELKKIVDLCQENDVLIFSDELHCDLTRANVTHHPLKTISDYSKIITAVALGKTFNVGGVPISQIIIDDEELKQIWHKETRKKHYISFAPPLDMVLAETAYNKCEYWVDEVMEYVEQNFDFLVDYLNKHLPKVKYKKPEGTFLAWINFGAYVDYEKLFELLITKYDLLIENGHVFGESGAGYFRMTVACPQSMLEEGLNRIVKAIKELTDN